MKITNIMPVSLVVIGLVAIPSGPASASRSSSHYHASTNCNLSKTTIKKKIAAKFGRQGNKAIRVAICESNLNPCAGITTPSQGLFQLRVESFDGNLLDADNNIKEAYRAYKTRGGWKAWRPLCHNA